MGVIICERGTGILIGNTAVDVEIGERNVKDHMNATAHDEGGALFHINRINTAVGRHQRSGFKEYVMEAAIGVQGVAAADPDWIKSSVDGCGAVHDYSV